MLIKSNSCFMTFLFVVVATYSGGCNAQTPESQFRVADLVYCVDVSNDGNFVAAGSRGDGSGTLTVFDVDRGAEAWSVDAGTWVWDVAFSPDQKWLVSGSDDGLQVWDVRGGRAPMVLPAPPNSLPEVKHLSISPGGKFLAASRAYKIELWDFVNRKFLRFIPTTGGGAVAFSPDEKLLAVAGYHNRLKVYDVESGSQLGEIHAQIGVLMAADFSPDGRTLVACSEGATKLFSINQSEDQVVISELAAFRSGLGADISANGKWLASGGYSGRVSINEVRSGNPLASIAVVGGEDSVYATKFSSDSKHLIVGGMRAKGPERSGVVQIWNVAEILGQAD